MIEISVEQFFLHNYSDFANEIRSFVPSFRQAFTILLSIFQLNKKW